MNKVLLSVGGMTCSSCSNGLEKFLCRQKGIVEASVNLVMASVLVYYDDTISMRDIEGYIKKAGFESLGEFDINKDMRGNSKGMLILFGIMTVISLYLSMGSMIGFPSLLDMKTSSYVIMFISVFYLAYGFDIIKNGFKNLIHKTSNMDTLVMIGILSSFIYSFVNLVKGNVHNLYFDSTIMIVFFIKIGRYIEGSTIKNAKSATKELVKITPDFVYTKDGKTTIDTVKVGDTFICRAGDRIGADGEVISGTGYFDEAFLTGEAGYIKKEVGMKVKAGSLCSNGYIEYRAEGLGRNSTISEIVRLVVDASNNKGKFNNIVNRVSGIFTYVIIALSIFTLVFYLINGYAWGEALNYFITVLVTSCPCALGLAAPLSIVISSNALLKNGILVKNSNVFETASKVNTVIFDKTGTLTTGNMGITKVVNYSEYSDKKLLSIVSSLEKLSNHPITSAFKRVNGKEVVTDFENLDGYGISGKINEDIYYIGNLGLTEKLGISENRKTEYDNLQILENSTLYVIRNKEVIGFICLSDTIRDDSARVVQELKYINKRVIMLTGDNEKCAKNVSDKLGIRTYKSNVTPKGKLNFIKRQIKNGNTVMMIGDGINDAPSLTGASTSVSFADGTDIASSSADVILLNNNLIDVVNLFIISRKTSFIIRENLFWTFIYNACMIPTSMGLFKEFGLTMNPMLGSLAMICSSLFVIGNSLRLKNIKLRK